MKGLIVFCLIVIMIGFVACAPKQVSIPLSDKIGAGSAGEAQGAGVQNDAANTGKGSGVSEEDLLRKSREEAGNRGAAGDDGSKGLLAGTDIYFDFDSYNLRADALPILKDTAKLLSREQTKRLTIEGHCDERGTTEYNMVLGQKRADAAKEYLIGLGVADKRIKAISYGKEAPADPNHTEDAWAKNRRVHLSLQ
jgi:peptidoglycan-associated lipoprotein